MGAEVSKAQQPIAQKKSGMAKSMDIGEASSSSSVPRSSLEQNRRLSAQGGDGLSHSSHSMDAANRNVLSPQNHSSNAYYASQSRRGSAQLLLDSSANSGRSNKSTAQTSVAHPQTSSPVRGVATYQSGDGEPTRSKSISYQQGSNGIPKSHRLDPRLSLLASVNSTSASQSIEGHIHSSKSYAHEEEQFRPQKFDKEKFKRANADGVQCGLLFTLLHMFQSTYK